MGWIGVDLDGTLAEWKEPYDVLQIGPPIPAMIERVKDWLAEGQDVRIFTARVGPASAAECVAALNEITTNQYVAVGLTDRDYLHVRDGDPTIFWQRYQCALIAAWCQEYLGQVLPITATKDFHLWQLWDDRCVQMVSNTGQPISELFVGRDKADPSCHACGGPIQLGEAVALYHRGCDPANDD
jgi:hypothetical protein